MRPWSDSMTGVSMARFEHHYIGLTVHSCPGLITFSLFGSVCGFRVHVYHFAVENIHFADSAFDGAVCDQRYMLQERM